MRYPILLLASCTILTLITSCREYKKHQPAERWPDQVFQTTLHQIRLGDGTPLSLSLSVRWEVEDPSTFFNQFESTHQYDSLIMQARSQEIASAISHTFQKVDSVFEGQRDTYLTSLKNAMYASLGEEGVIVKEIMIADIGFPSVYMQTREQIAIQAQELAQISRQKELHVARAEAQREQAEADGQIAIAQAEARGRLEKMEANIEASRRRRQLAQAETERQVSEKKAQAEADRQRQLKQVAVQQAREMEMIQVEKQRALDKVAFEKELQIAQMCQDNPAYANFLINKELAGHVQIAVLPSGQEGPLLGNLIQQTSSHSPEKP